MALGSDGFGGNELVLALVVGSLFAGGFYSMLRRNALRFVFGLLLLSNGVNLLIFTVSQPRQTAPPIIPYSADAPTETVANALPQALILTAIVIGFGLVAFTLVLLLRSYETLGSLHSDELPGRLEWFAEHDAPDVESDAEAGTEVGTEVGAGPDDAPSRDRAPSAGADTGRERRPQ